MIQPVLKYPGSKWRLAKSIVPYLPAHNVYLEPFLGSGGVFFNKEPARHEILNDLDGDIANLFRVMRDHGQELADLIAFTPWSRAEYESIERDFNVIDGPRSEDPIENARRFLVRCWQAHGTRTDKLSGWRHVGPKGDADTVRLWRKLPDRLRSAIDRLQDAEIECQPALTLIQEYGKEKECCIYGDPPYVHATRSGGTYYKHEMTLDDHVLLLDTLDACKCPVVLSGYAHPLYDERLKHWTRITIDARAEHGLARTEVLWLNPRAARCQQLRMWED